MRCTVRLVYNVRILQCNDLMGERYGVDLNTGKQSFKHWLRSVAHSRLRYGSSDELV